VCGYTGKYLYFKAIFFIDEGSYLQLISKRLTQYAYPHQLAREWEEKSKSRYTAKCMQGFLPYSFNLSVFLIFHNEKLKQKRKSLGLPKLQPFSSW
jgi:hypothetical protein